MFVVFRRSRSFQISIIFIIYHKLLLFSAFLCSRYLAIDHSSRKSSINFAEHFSIWLSRHWTLRLSSSRQKTMTSRGSLVLAGRNEFGATWFASQGHLSSRRVQGLQKRRTWAALKDKDKRRRWWLHDWGLLLAWRWKSHERKKHGIHRNSSPPCGLRPTVFVLRVNAGKMFEPPSTDLANLRSKHVPSSFEWKDEKSNFPNRQ